jgi:hypothetical protein
VVTINPFGRELLLSDVPTGFQWSTWIQRILWPCIWLCIDHEHDYDHDHEGHIELKPLIFKVRPVL